MSRRLRRLAISCKNFLLDAFFPFGRKKVINGITCVLPASIHRGIPNKISQLMLDHILASCNGDRMTVFDVGAHIGTWSAIIAAHIGKGGTVCSFEPNRHNFPMLKKQASVNPLGNIKPFQVAVSDVQGLVEFVDRFTTEDTFHASAKSQIRAADGRSGYGNSYKVKSITLEKFVEEERIWPDVVKIDVEGAEFQVLLGMKAVLLERKVTLFVELHQFAWENFRVSAADFFAFADAIGYRIYKNGITLIKAPDEDFIDNLRCGYVKIAR